MKIIEHAKEGLLNLYFAKLRTLLALLGVLVGTASVVAMVLGGELATNEALQQFKSLGTDLFAVSINLGDDNRSSSSKLESLALNDALGLTSADPAITDVAPYTQLFFPMFYDNAALNGMILGVTTSFSKILNIHLNSGRFISTLDQYERYCVIGKEIYTVMKKGSFKDPLGQQLQIGKEIFTIVGIADNWPENNFVYANINYSVMIPILATTALSKYASINNIIMRLQPSSPLSQVENHVSHYLNELLTDRQVSFRSAKELITKMRKQSDILTVFLGLIGSVSLFVGGIGVMNIMLVSVMERKREIGIRLAVGAKRSDISTLFLIESVMLSLVGGILGVLIGIIIAFIIAKWWNWSFTLFLWPPLAGFSVSVAVGIFFGAYPAYLASRLDPIDALRSE